MRRIVFAVWLGTLGGSAHAGHEFPFYPSFYPQEITVEALAAEAAAHRLANGTLHAYAGKVEKEPPKTRAVESLAGYVLAKPNAGTSCAETRGHKAALGDASIWHPYPVTPFHADYLHHADRAETARAGVAAHAAQAKVDVEIVEARALMARARMRYNGWEGPPWISQGWFHAYLLLAPVTPDARIEEAARRLMRGEYRSLKERIALERNLVELLQRNCERVVLGYTVRREHYATEYSGGVENVGHDALRGLASAIFPRTVKLRDFPWNGWLNVAVPALPGSPWNPLVGGFGDAFGSLVSRAVIDPALFPSPHGARWIENRVHVKPGKAGAALAVPETALLPEPRTGRLVPVGPGKTAASRIIYEVRNSAFHDGTPMNVADILYAYAFAAAWGSGAGADPGIARASALARERLKGVRFLGMHVDTLAFGEDKLTYEVPRFEVYLDAAGDATVAPPWTTLPWHLLALFEEGARRGLYPLSEFDPVRDPAVVSRLAQLASELEERSHVPAALKSRMKAAEARERYRRLREFHAAHGHWLITNGPYLLSRWDGAKAVLTVFRDPTYPKGVGSYDAYSVPLKAHVTRIEPRPYGAEVQTEIEWLERLGRDVEIVRGPIAKHLAGRPPSAAAAATPACRYLLLRSDGALAAAGVVRAGSNGACRLSFKPLRGDRLVLAAILGDTTANAPIKIVPWE